MKIYVGIPYTGMEEKSFKKANEVSYKLMKSGNIVYSPISHCHPIAQVGGLPTDWDYWKEYCTEFVTWCDTMAVVMMKGWEDSTGLTAELEIARELKKNIMYIN